jgi:hypothetical protein
MTPQPITGPCSAEALGAEAFAQHMKLDEWRVVLSLAGLLARYPMGDEQRAHLRGPEARVHEMIGSCVPEVFGEFINGMED